MKSPHHRCCISLVILFGLAWAFCESLQAADGEVGGRWRKVKDATELIPMKDSSKVAPFQSVALRKQLKRKLSDEERGLLARTATGEWKEFSDDLISFELPNDPLLKVDVFTPEEKPALGIVGGAVGSADNSFQRVYRITFSDGAPYGLVLVSNNRWFDEGICLCGSISLKSFVHADGNLTELSQMDDGAVKKFQVINDTHRAILFEWTHSAITQSAYCRIGASLRLKPGSNRTTEQWIALTKAKRGTNGGLGWLRLGTEIGEAEKLLGTPSDKKSTRLVYVDERRWNDGRGFRQTIVLPFTDGKLAILRGKWSSADELKPPRGSNAWIEDTMRAWSDKADDLPEGKKANLPSDDVKLILKLYHEKAKSAGGEEWGFWCNVIAELARLGVRDQEAANYIASRSGDMELPQFGARHVFELYDLPGYDEFVRKRLVFLMGESEGAARFRGEANNLFSSVKPDDEASLKLIREGLVHQSASIRSAAVTFATKLPADEARQGLRKALDDPNKEVRFHAIVDVDKVFSKEDAAWLKEVAGRESEEMNREALEERITELK